MSKTTIESIMEELKLNLTETEKQDLDFAFNNEFGLIGGFGYCEKLSHEWETNPEGVKKMIFKIIKKKPNKLMEVNLNVRKRVHKR